ncbi:TPA: adenosine kinase [Candidatus Woesearchaeota archaeon]|nr:adenosine kinase [Candidatus Woesearchaeota archaeon]
MADEKAPSDKPSVDGVLYDVYGIGNPIMDVLVELSHEDLKLHPLKKGTFNLVTSGQLKAIQDFIKQSTLVPGGSVANTMALFSQLGGKAAFCGKVGRDRYAQLYNDEMMKVGVTTHLRDSDVMTGTALTFITPDKDRTFAVHLGAALHLKKEDIDIEAVKRSRYVHVAGYVLEDPNLREAALHALAAAKERGTKISIDCADPALIERCREDMLKIVTEYADIVFANEDEATALMGVEDPHVACNQLAKICEIAVVKLGKKGSLIRKGNEVACIDPFLVNAVDTTGAGDSYAAAFLFALSKGHDIETAGRLGSYIASRVVQTLGARLPEAPDVSHILDENKEEED